MPLSKPDLDEVEEIASEQVSTEWDRTEFNIEVELAEFGMEQPHRVDDSFDGESGSRSEVRHDICGARR